MFREFVEFVDGNRDVITALTALFGVVLSFISISLASYTFFLSRRHDRLLIRPLPWITAGRYKDRLYVWMQNNGTGPLQIVKFQVTDVATGNTHNSVIDHMPALSSGQKWSRYFGPIDGRTLLPGEKLELLVIEKSQMDSEVFAENRDGVRDKLSGLKVVVSFQDVVGRKQPDYLKELSWFGASFPADEVENSDPRPI